MIFYLHFNDIFIGVSKVFYKKENDMKKIFCLVLLLVGSSQVLADSLMGSDPRTYSPTSSSMLGSDPRTYSPTSLKVTAVRAALEPSIILP